MTDRKEKIRIIQETIRLCREHEQLRQKVQESIGAERIIWAQDSVPFNERLCEPAQLILSPKRTMEAARPYAMQGKKVCVLNFASAVSPGGGVLQGYAAQEESLCRVSTLYPALRDQRVQAFYRRHLEMVRQDGMGWKNTDDCIYTPGVYVIREDTSDCALMAEENWYPVRVITCAAPDLRFADLDRAETSEELLNIFVRRMRRIVAIAAQEENDVLILGAFGCGVFMNPPGVLVRALSHVLLDPTPPRPMHCFRTIEFAVFSPCRNHPNYRAFLSLPGIREDDSR